MRQLFSRSIIVAALFVSSFVFSFHALASNPIANISGLKSPCEFQTGGIGVWKNVKLKQALYAGDHLRTGAGGYAVIVFKDGSTIKIGDFSLIVINIGMATGGQQPTLELKNGKILARVKRLTADGSAFTIKTPTVLTGVRGTEFALEIDETRSTMLVVVEGSVNFSNDHGSVIVNESEKSYAAPGSAPTPPEKVDTLHWIKWTFDVREMGMSIETPFFSQDKDELASINSDYDKQIDMEPEGSEAYLNLARVRYDLGDFETAEFLFRQEIEFDENNIDAMYGLGMTLNAIGHPDESIAVFHKAIDKAGGKAAMGTESDGREEVDPVENDGSISNVVNSLSPGESEKGTPGSVIKKSRPQFFPIDSGDESVLETESQPQILAKKNLPDLYFGMGLAYLKKNELKNAGNAFENALKQDSDFARAYLGLGVVSVRRGESDQADEYFNKSIELDPDLFPAQVRLALVHLSRNKMDDALSEAENAVETAPFSPDARAALARILFFSDRLGEAREQAQAALELDPYNSPAHDVLSRLFVLENKLDHALSEALKSAALDSDNPFAHDALALVYKTYMKYTGAIQQWEKAVELDPSLTGPRLRLAELLNQLGRPEDAERHLLTALKFEPGNDELIGELGRSYELQKYFNESETYYLKAIAHNPNRALHHSRIASFYIDRYEISPALEHALRAVDIEPGNPFHHYILGVVYDAMDHSDGATIEFQEALRIDPDYSLARYRLGVIYAKNDRPREAINEVHWGALNDPRVISLSEYRGNDRITFSVDDNDLRYSELILSKTTRQSRFNYRIVGLFDTTSGFRMINSDSKESGASFLAGFIKDYENSLFVYADTYNTNIGTPLSININDSDDRMEFNMKNYELAWHGNIGQKTKLSLRVSRNYSAQINSCPNNGLMVQNIDACLASSSYDDYSAKLKETEFRIDRRYKKHHFIVGGFKDDSKLERILVFPSLIYSGERYRTQKNFYFESRFVPNDRLSITLGWENYFHNIYGSESSTKALFEYRQNERTVWRFLSKDPFRLPYFPQYQPNEAWAVVSDTDLTIDNQQGNYHEIDFTRRMKGAALVKIAVFSEDIDNYSQEMPSVEKFGGQATLEKHIDRLTVGYVSYTVTDFSDATSGGNYSGNTVPGFANGSTDLGVFHFPAPDWQVRIFVNKTDGYFLDPNNDISLPGFTIYNLQIKYEPRIDRSYFVNVDNLLNKKYETTIGHPESGRLFSCGFRVWF